MHAREAYSGQVTPSVSATPERWDDIGPMRIHLSSLQLAHQKSEENVNEMFALLQQTEESIQDLQTKMANATEQIQGMEQIQGKLDFLVEQSQSTKQLQTTINLVAEKVQSQQADSKSSKRIQSNLDNAAESSPAKGKGGSPQNAQRQWEGQSLQTDMLNNLQSQQAEILQHVELRHAEIQSQHTELLKTIQSQHAQVQSWQADISKRIQIVQSQHSDLSLNIHNRQHRWEAQHKADMLSIKDLLSQSLRPVVNASAVGNGPRVNASAFASDDEVSEGQSRRKDVDSEVSSEGPRRRKGQPPSSPSKIKNTVVDECGPASGSDTKDVKRVNGKSKHTIDESGEGQSRPSDTKKLNGKSKHTIDECGPGQSRLSLFQALKGRYQQMKFATLGNMKSWNSTFLPRYLTWFACLLVFVVLLHQIAVKVNFLREHRIGSGTGIDDIEGFDPKQNASLGLQAPIAVLETPVAISSNAVEGSGGSSAQAATSLNNYQEPSQKQETLVKQETARPTQSASSRNDVQELMRAQKTDINQELASEEKRTTHGSAPGSKKVETLQQPSSSSGSLSDRQPASVEKKRPTYGPLQSNSARLKQVKEAYNTEMHQHNIKYNERQSVHEKFEQTVTSIKKSQAGKKNHLPESQAPGTQSKSKKSAEDSYSDAEKNWINNAKQKWTKELASMDQRFNVNFKDAENRTKLHNASREGDVAVAKIVMENERFTELSAEDNYGQTALHLAAYHGVKEIVLSLLRNLKFGPVNAKDKKGWTAVHCAASMGHYDVLVALMGNGRVLSADAPDNEGKTSLHLAAEAGQSLFVKMLLGKTNLFKGANYKDNHGMTPLHYAAASGHAATINEFLKSRRFTEVTARDNEGATALHFASKEGHLQAVNALMKHQRFAESCFKSVGTEGDICEPDKSTVLGTCTGAHKLNKGRMCTLQECQELCTTTSDCHFLYWAKSGQNQGQCKKLSSCKKTRRVDKTVFTDVYQIFAKNYCKLVNSENADGSTALTLAVKAGAKDVTLALLQNPDFEKVNAVGKSCQGWTALHHAANHGHVDVVNAIIQHKLFEGANAKDSSGMTALHIAATRGFPHVVEVLLQDLRVAPNSRDTRGWSALHMAGHANHAEVVKSLLKLRKGRNAVSLTTRDRKGRSAIHVSEEAGNFHIAKAIKEAIEERGEKEEEMEGIGSSA